MAPPWPVQKSWLFAHARTRARVVLGGAPCGRTRGGHQSGFSPKRAKDAGRAQKWVIQQAFANWFSHTTYRSRNSRMALCTNLHGPTKRATRGFPAAQHWTKCTQQRLRRTLNVAGLGGAKRHLCQSSVLGPRRGRCLACFVYMWRVRKMSWRLDTSPSIGCDITLRNARHE